MSYFSDFSVGYCGLYTIAFPSLTLPKHLVSSKALEVPSSASCRHRTIPQDFCRQANKQKQIRPNASKCAPNQTCAVRISCTTVSHLWTFRQVSQVWFDSSTLPFEHGRTQTRRSVARGSQTTRRLIGSWTFLGAQAYSLKPSKTHDHAAFEPLDPACIRAVRA